MCRLAAFPPGTPPEFAHEVIANCVRGNDDGVGSAYVSKGEIVVNKYPYSYQEAVTQKKLLFDHMPFKGWTIAHVRMATHGGNTFNNTHPIVRGRLAVVHNGVFYGSGLVRSALDDSVKWQGETDSEVAAYMLNKLGPEAFYKAMPTGAGVYVALAKDGSLQVVKCSGDLEIIRMSNETCMLASEFPTKMERRDVKYGFLEFDAEGHPKKFKFEDKTEDKWGRFRDFQNNYDENYLSGYGHGCRLVEKDIHRPRGEATDSTSATSTDSKTNRADSKASMATAVGIIGTPKKKEWGLWSWPDDDKAFEEVQATK